MLAVGEKVALWIKGDFPHQHAAKVTSTDYSEVTGHVLEQDGAEKSAGSAGGGGGTDDSKSTVDLVTKWADSNLASRRVQSRRHGSSNADGSRKPGDGADGNGASLDESSDEPPVEYVKVAVNYKRKFDDKTELLLNWKQENGAESNGDSRHHHHHNGNGGGRRNGRHGNHRSRHHGNYNGGDHRRGVLGAAQRQQQSGHAPPSGQCPLGVLSPPGVCDGSEAYVMTTLSSSLPMDNNGAAAAAGAVSMMPPPPPPPPPQLPPTLLPPAAVTAAGPQFMANGQPVYAVQNGNGELVYTLLPAGEAPQQPQQQQSVVFVDANGMPVDYDHNMAAAAAASAGMPVQVPATAVVGACGAESSLLTQTAAAPVMQYQQAATVTQCTPGGGSVAYASPMHAGSTVVPTGYMQAHSATAAANGQTAAATAMAATAAAGPAVYAAMSLQDAAAAGYIVPVVAPGTSSAAAAQGQQYIACQQQQQQPQQQPHGGQVQPVAVEYYTAAMPVDVVDQTAAYLPISAAGATSAAQLQHSQHIAAVPMPMSAVQHLHQAQVMPQAQAAQAIHALHAMPAMVLTQPGMSLPPPPPPPVLPQPFPGPVAAGAGYCTAGMVPGLPCPI